METKGQQAREMRDLSTRRLPVPDVGQTEREEAEAWEQLILQETAHDLDYEMALRMQMGWDGPESDLGRLQQAPFAKTSEADQALALQLASEWALEDNEFMTGPPSGRLSDYNAHCRYSLGQASTSDSFVRDEMAHYKVKRV